VAVDDAVRDVGDARRLDRADLLEVEVADILKEPRAGTEQDRDQVQLELINQPGGQVLLDGAGASSQQHISATRGLLGCSSAASIPSVTKTKVVPPSISKGSRGWW
jgi:hypothetical protein